MSAASCFEMLPLRPSVHPFSPSFPVTGITALTPPPRRCYNEISFFFPHIPPGTDLFQLNRVSNSVRDGTADRRTHGHAYGVPVADGRPDRCTDRRTHGDGRPGRERYRNPDGEGELVQTQREAWRVCSFALEAKKEVVFRLSRVAAAMSVAVGYAIASAPVFGTRRIARGRQLPP